jgi:hypothetical protein
MNRKALLFVVVMLAAMLAIPAFASNDDMTIVHVKEPVAIPGHVLKPGAYIFRLADTATQPPFVEVMSQSGSRTYGFIPVFTASRGADQYGNEIDVKTDNSGLARISAFYLPGMNDGYRFIYSRSDLRKADLMASRMEKSGTIAGM